jgi:hypothetical protein
MLICASLLSRRLLSPGDLELYVIIDTVDVQLNILAHRSGGHQQGITSMTSGFA